MRFLVGSIMARYLKKNWYAKHWVGYGVGLSSTPTNEYNHIAQAHADELFFKTMSVD